MMLVVVVLLSVLLVRRRVCVCTGFICVSERLLFLYHKYVPTIGLIRTVVSMVHCGCTDRSSILRLDRNFFCNFDCHFETK